MSPNAMLGYNVHVLPDDYRTLAEDVPVSDEFRQEFNAWMRSFFKPTNALADGEVHCFGNRLYMNPRTYAAFKKAL